MKETIEKTFENAFLKALDQIIGNKMEDLFKKAFGNGSSLAKKLEEKIGQGFARFVQAGIRWERKKPSFKN